MKARTFLVAVLCSLVGVLPSKAQDNRRAGSLDQDDPAQILVGTWRSDRGETVTISAHSPGSVIFQGRHEWSGRVDLAADGRVARLRLARKPKVTEMNRETPEWARRKVEGQLEWTLELTFKDCPDSELRGYWYKGTIQWQDGKPGRAEVGERGEGVPVSYVLVSRSTAPKPVDSPSVQGAGPKPPSRVEEAGKAYFAVKDRFTAISNSLKEAQGRLKSAEVALDEAVLAEDEDFARISLRIAELQKRIAEDSVALARVESEEDGHQLLVDRLTELRRQYDILKDYAQYLSPGFLRELSRQVRETGQDLAAAKEARATQSKPIQDRLVQLRRQLNVESENQLKSIDAFANSSERDAALREMRTAAADVEKARQVRFPLFFVFQPVGFMLPASVGPES